MQRRACLLVILTTCVAGACGCRSMWQRLRGSSSDEPGSSAEAARPEPMSLAVAQAVLRGDRPGILVAANGGLTSLPTKDDATKDMALPNSLAALRGAIDAGIPMIVVEVRTTADGVAVLDLDRLSQRGGSGRLNIDQTDLATLRSQTEDRANGPIPTLVEALEAARGRLLVGVRPGGDRIEPIVTDIDRTGLTDQVVVLMDGPRQAQSARPYLKRDPPILIGMTAPTPERLTAIETSPPWPMLVHLGHGAVSPSNIGRVNAMGARAMVHQRGVLLVRIGTDLKPFYRIGVTVVLTDWPRQLLREMRELNAQAVPAEQEPVEQDQPQESKGS